MARAAPTGPSHASSPKERFRHRRIEKTVLSFSNLRLSNTRFIHFRSSFTDQEFNNNNNNNNMAPVIPSPGSATLGKLARRALITAGPALAQPHIHNFSKRGLSVNHTQGVTLGVIGAYIVVIALLWNLPYVRWVLWPFKVRLSPLSAEVCLASQSADQVVDVGHRFPRVWSCDNSMLYWRSG